MSGQLIPGIVISFIIISGILWYLALNKEQKEDIKNIKNKIKIFSNKD